MVLLVVSGAIGIGNWLDLKHIPGADQGGVFLNTGVKVGWGLVATTLASFVGAAASAYQLWQDELR